MERPNYENWIPKYMVNGLIALTAILGVIFLFVLGLYISTGNMKSLVLIVVLGINTIIVGVFAERFRAMRNSFDFGRYNSLSRKIINFTANYVNCNKEGAKILDVGCGSGALTIACAKRNPKAKIIGIDRWGKEYKSFSQDLCIKNAETEKVFNTDFIAGNAVKLDFNDETFDFVTSNYVYHNITGNKQKYISETLRVLKKGGSFAIHDLFSHKGYGDMNKYIQMLISNGFEKVELLDTTKGVPMNQRESNSNMLQGSKLLIGTK